MGSVMLCLAAGWAGALAGVLAVEEECYWPLTLLAAATIAGLGGAAVYYWPYVTIGAR